MAKAKAAKKAVKKTKKPKAAAKKAGSVVAVPPLPKVRVRMFRQGLGDCFLLTFDVGGHERHMLIDCGTLGKKNTTVEMSDIAEHIFKIIGAGNLDLVVATHEHHDHLSGFNNKEIKKLQGRVDHVWLAWTENPNDDDAKLLAKNKRDLGAALAIVAEAAPKTAVGQQVYDLMGFAGDMSLGAASFAETVNAAMEFVRTGLGAATVYLNPGQVIEESWLPGFRFYVLGPPRSKDFLKDLGKHGSDELYGISAGLRSAALLHLDAELQTTRSLSAAEFAAIESELPFDQRFNVQKNDEITRTWYESYFAASEEWRTIDSDWMAPASDLALQLDSLTNNTSLALAIERIADGKVLLFPADAQQGHWLSWHAPEMKWNIPQPTGGTHEVNAENLLARTVFYKVGHHSSHNATARAKGLEMMKQENNLTAFIPVDRAVALTRNPKGSWQMPAHLLYRRLLEQCQGRVARSDIGWATKPVGEAAKTTESEFKKLATDQEWTEWEKSQAAATHVRMDDLFIEYVLA